MKRLYLDVELTTGEVLEHVRVLTADRIRAVNIARANAIPLEDGPELVELLAYAATTRTGAVPAGTLSEWRAQAIDVAASEEEPTGEDPTSAPSGA